MRGKPTGVSLEAARFLARHLGRRDRSGCFFDGGLVARRLRLAEIVFGTFDAVVVVAAAAACARTPHKHARTK